jgi:DnaJ-class molecular chaperone
VQHPAERSDAVATTSVTLEEVLTGTERVLQVGGKRLEVRVPAGVRDGQRIRLSGKAEGGGHIYLTVTVEPHKTFTRDGANLTRELPLTLGEALLGGKVHVETLGGKRLLLTIPTGTQQGRVFRLTGQGLPRATGDGRGDLLVRTRVVLPTHLDEEGRSLASALVEHVDQPDPRS